MALTVQTLPLTEAETRASERVNAGLALAPRLKTDGWRMALGMRLNGPLGEAAGRITGALLKGRGVKVSTAVIDGPAGELSLRVLEPISPPRAMVVDFHGGGWVVGSAALNDRITGHLAEAGLVVVSVDYRLLDEALGIGMPDAVADCVAAIRWAMNEGVRHFGVDRVFVVGESAGAHLAALALLRLRDEGVISLPPCVFVQGVFDLSGTPSAGAAGPETLLFDGPNLQRDLGRLTPDRDESARRHPDVSPLYADMTDMPPALFVMGRADPFRDDSRLMAEAWSRFAPVVLLDVPTAPHGFQHFGAPTAALAQAFIRRWIDDSFADGPVSVDNPRH